MKTKYIKVSVSEKKPLKGEVYFTYDDDFSKSTRLFDARKKKFFGRTQPLEYLLEVPDREDEMREMLVRMYSALTELQEVDEESEIFRSIIPDEIEQLLNELKQTT